MLEILKIIKKNRIVSRPEIALQTKLTSVTVSTLIGELMKNNIVVEEGFANSIGGRKAALYRFNESAYYIIGVNMRLSNVSIDLYDLGAKMVHRGAVIHMKEGQSVENIISAIIRGIHKLIADTKDKYPETIGIGVTVPGRVDFEHGLICHLTNLKDWVNIPLKDILEAETGIRTYIERDTNSHISYLKWLDVTENRSNVVYCEVGDGIGAAVMIDGSVYRGEHGLAGEVGHTIVDLDGPLCNCGNHGCVEVFSSNKAITDQYLKNYKELNGREDEELVAQLSGDYDDNEVIDMLAHRALAGDAAADKAFTRACRYVFACMVGVVNTYNPSLIIIESQWMRTARRYFTDLVTKVFESNRLLDRKDIKIILNPVDDIYSQGCSTIILEQLFSDIDNNRLIG
jgi:predicted NBD/HSP70 family sugar kinase